MYRSNAVNLRGMLVYLSDPRTMGVKAVPSWIRRCFITMCTNV